MPLLLYPKYPTVYPIFNPVSRATISDTRQSDTTRDRAEIIDL